MSDYESPAATPTEYDYVPNPKRRKVERPASSIPRHDVVFTDGASTRQGEVTSKATRLGEELASKDDDSPAALDSPSYDHDSLGRTPLDVRSPGSRSVSRSPSRHLPNGLGPHHEEEEDPLERSFAPPPRRKIQFKKHKVLEGHRKGVSQVQFSPDGKYIASCSADAKIKIWDVTTGRVLHTMEGHLAGISTIAWSPDSKTLVSGSDDKAVRLWNRMTGKPYPRPLIGHHNYVYSIAFSPKGNMIASGSYDEAVLLWDVRAGKQIKSLPAHSDPVSGIDFVRDGTLIASCSTDGLIRIWDTATGQCLRTLVHEDNAPVTAVRFSPNGRFVLAWTLDSCIRLWDYVEGKCLKTYQSHTNIKFSLLGSFGITGGHDVMSRTGKREIIGQEAFIVSGSEDGDILIWDVKSKEVLQRLQGGHDGVVLCVSVNGKGVGEDRNMLASCGADGKIVLWRVDEDEVTGAMEQAVYANGDLNGGYANGADGHVDRYRNLDDGAHMADAQVDTPDAEVDTFDARVNTPDAQADTPDLQADTPDAQADTPDAQDTFDAHVSTSEVQVDTPDVQGDIPDAHSNTPDAQADTPTASATTPHFKEEDLSEDMAALPPAP